MATAKKTFIDIELEFAEMQLKSWKAYVEANPIHELRDRIEWKQTKTGGAMPMVVATIEAQGKFLQETMKNYLTLLAEVEKLRENEAKKQILARGGQTLSPFESDEI